MKQKVLILLMLWCTAMSAVAQDRLSQLYVLGGELSNSAATSVEDRYPCALLPRPEY